MKKRNILRSIPYTVICALFLTAFWTMKLTHVDINDEFENLSELITAGEHDNSDAEISEIIKDGESDCEENSLIAGNGENNTAGSEYEIDGEGISSDTVADNDVNIAENNNSETVDSESNDPKTDDRKTDDQESCEAVLADFYSREYDEEGYPFCKGTLSDGYICYEPETVKSKYYTDAGMIALTSYADYSEVSDEYFDDACFIGDSRMVGIYDYCGWENADFYCDNGFCVNTYINGGTVKCHTDNKNYTLEQAIQKKTYGKIYIMLGINDCGYATTEVFAERYGRMISMIREYQPDAVIFLMANLNIAESAEKKDETGVYTNININAKNAAIAGCADPKENIYYLDYNSLFCDEKGYLKSESTFDGFHLYAQYYIAWTDYFRSHGIEE